MADQISLNSFPCNESEALAILYMQNQDLSEKFPEDLAVLYVDAETKIKNAISDERKKQEQNSKPWFPR